MIAACLEVLGRLDEAWPLYEESLNLRKVRIINSKYNCLEFYCRCIRIIYRNRYFLYYLFFIFNSFYFIICNIIILITLYLMKSICEDHKLLLLKIHVSSSVFVFLFLFRSHQLVYGPNSLKVAESMQVSFILWRL